MSRQQQPDLVNTPAAESRRTGVVVRDLHTTFGTGAGAVDAVRGVDLEVRPEESYVLLGESGSGKSVTARSILRLYGTGVRHTGSVTLDGAELLGLDERRLQTVRGRRIGMVPQDPTAALDPLRTIGRQLAEVLKVHGAAGTRRRARHRARELLEQVGIPDPDRVIGSRPHQLSGGMRQRAVIALAIACDPEVLIADEPTTALDVTVQAQVIELFLRLQADTGMSLLMVTHDVGVAEELGGRVGVMYAGRIVETGPVDEVLTTPRHPYTRGLLASLPTPGTARGGLTVIPGRPPLTGEVLPGCAFATRCPVAIGQCRERTPLLIPLSTTRAAACPVQNGAKPATTLSDLDHELTSLEMTA